MPRCKVCSKQCAEESMYVYNGLDVYCCSEQCFTSFLDGEKKKEETENNLSSMMTMLGSFTILRLTSLLGAGHVEVTKEQLLDLNEKLNKVECSVKTLA